MITKITKQFLVKHNACKDGYKYWCGSGKINVDEFIEHCINDKDNADTDDTPLNYANWLIVRCMDRKQNIAYAVFSAYQCLPEFERVFPDDNRPRKAIEAAAACIKHNTKENRSAAKLAAKSAAKSAAWSAESAARSAESAAGSEMQIKILRYGISLMTK